MATKMAALPEQIGCTRQACRRVKGRRRDQVSGLLQLISALLLLASALVGSVAHAESATTVTIQGEVSATVTFPSRTVPVVLVVNANASATGGDRLHGSGGHVARAFGREFIESSAFQLEGDVVADSVVLAGTIVESNAPPLIGASVKIAANTASGAIELTLSSIERGPFAGQTLRFVGSGSVVVNRQ